MIQAKGAFGIARSSRRWGIALLAFGLLAITAMGCQPLGLMSDEPRRLLEEARTSSQQGDLETAYWHLKRIRTDFPESPESDEAFLRAAYLWKKLWFRDRYVQPDSVWRTSETGFLFEWLASFFDGAEGFPQRQVDALLRSLPFNVYQDFAAYAKTHPELSGWVLHVEEDNGRIRSVTGERARAPAR
jgi:hypothetical protein